MGNTIHWGWIPDCIRIERASWALSKHTCIVLHSWLWMWYLLPWLPCSKGWPILTPLQRRLTCLDSLAAKTDLRPRIVNWMKPFSPLSCFLSRYLSQQRGNPDRGVTPHCLVGQNSLQNTHCAVQSMALIFLLLNLPQRTICFHVPPQTLRSKILQNRS